MLLFHYEFQIFDVSLSERLTYLPILKIADKKDAICITDIYIF